MANGLEVDPDRLRRAAAASSAVAAALVGAGTGTIPVSQPSGAGVAAVAAALTELQSRQSARITGQAGALTVSGALFERVDHDGADAVTAVSV